MQTSIQKIFNPLKCHQGFALIEILVALILAALVFLAVPSGDIAQKHRELKTSVEDIDRSIRFAANESVLRNTVVRLKLDLEKNPVEYFVEYGPPGNFPLPEMVEQKSLSLEQEKAEQEKIASLNRQFAKVEEFDDIKHELSDEVEILGVATTTQKKLVREGEAYIYFYPTGEKDASIIFFATTEELAVLEVEPFLSKTHSVFLTLQTESVAKAEDILQTKMDEVYNEWISK